MPPKKGKKRNAAFDMDEFVERKSSHLSRTSHTDTIPELHTLYEGNHPAVRTYIEVPSVLTMSGAGHVGEGARVDVDDDIPGLEDAELSDDEGDNDGDNGEHTLEAAGLGNIQQIEVVSRQRRKRTDGVRASSFNRDCFQTYGYLIQDNPLKTWIPHIDIYVEELLRHESCNIGEQLICANVTCDQSIMDQPSASFRCIDCQTSALYCSSCILLLHQRLPLHRVEVDFRSSYIQTLTNYYCSFLFQRWNGLHFERTLLKTLGLRIQLGHDSGQSCPNPLVSFNDDFTIIDSDGIHKVGIDYCGCSQSLPKTVQLLRSRLFPSTVVDPKTAATFRVLETFQMLSFTSKVSAYEYYRSLIRRTDNTGTVSIPVRQFF